MPEQKKPTLETSHEFLQRAAVRNPTDTATRTHQIWVELELGDVAQAAGDSRSAVGFYTMAMRTADAGDLADPADERRYIAAVRNLAEIQARSGNRAGALASLDHVLQLAGQL